MRILRKQQSKTEISTASMPDIVFLLLFFFMVSATIKPQENLVKTKIPQAHALTKIQKQYLIKELQIGQPTNPEYGIGIKISTGDQIISISELCHWVEAQKSTLDETSKDQMIVLLRADENINMGLITDVQQELRKHNARKILYRTLERD